MISAPDIILFKQLILTSMLMQISISVGKAHYDIYFYTVW